MDLVVLSLMTVLMNLHASSNSGNFLGYYDIIVSQLRMVKKSRCASYPVETHSDKVIPGPGVNSHIASYEREFQHVGDRFPTVDVA